MMPHRFLPNRVKRLYYGGSGIDRLRGASSPEDTLYPEDWIASCVIANSKNVPAGHGLSTVDVGDMSTLLFTDMLRNYGDAVLGPAHRAAFGDNPGFLSKLLDSAVRLPVQVHPDKAAAKRLFNSPYGKTEAWIIFATREIGERPYIYLGFNETLDEKVFRDESEAGVYERGLSMLHKFEVKPGDVYVVHGRLPHAIGPGVTMVEVMEPTDITINPERVCCGVELPTERRFARQTPENAIDLFDFTPRSIDDVRKMCCPEPEFMQTQGNGSLVRIIPRKGFNFFEAQRLSFSNRWEMDPVPEFRVGIVIKGSLSVRHAEGSLDLHSGDSFFIPYACEKCTLNGAADVIFLLPPLP